MSPADFFFFGFAELLLAAELAEALLDLVAEAAMLPTRLLLEDGLLSAVEEEAAPALRPGLAETSAGDDDEEEEEEDEEPEKGSGVFFFFFFELLLAEGFESTEEDLTEKAGGRATLEAEEELLPCFCCCCEETMLLAEEAKSLVCDVLLPFFPPLFDFFDFLVDFDFPGGWRLPGLEEDDEEEEELVLLTIELCGQFCDLYSADLRDLPMTLELTLLVPPPPPPVLEHCLQLGPPANELAELAKLEYCLLACLLRLASSLLRSCVAVCVVKDLALLRAPASKVAVFSGAVSSFRWWKRFPKLAFSSKMEVALLPLKFLPP